MVISLSALSEKNISTFRPRIKELYLNLIWVTLSGIPGPRYCTKVFFSEVCVNSWTFLILLLFACARVQKQEDTLPQIDAEINRSFQEEFRSFPDSLRLVLPQKPLERFQQEWGEVDNPPALYTLPVISPEEMKVLKKFITQAEIEEHARASYLQNSSYNVLCLGQEEDDLFLVLESDDLLKLRLEYFDLFRLRGGDRDDFHPVEYTPIIPLNRTPSSLKNLSAKGKEDCLSDLEFSPVSSRERLPQERPNQNNQPQHDHEDPKDLDEHGNS